jgi:hypothetical protein
MWQSHLIHCRPQIIQFWLTLRVCDVVSMSRTALRLDAPAACSNSAVRSPRGCSRHGVVRAVDHLRCGGSPVSTCQGAGSAPDAHGQRRPANGPAAHSCEGTRRPASLMRAMRASLAGEIMHSCLASSLATGGRPSRPASVRPTPTPWTAPWQLWSRCPCRSSSRTRRPAARLRWVHC